MKHFLKILVVLFVVGAITFWVWKRIQTDDNSREDESYADRPVPVAVTPVVKDSIERRRVLSGTLEPHSEFRVAPKIGGQLTEMLVDFSDVVTPAQVVANLDDTEIQQQVLQAEANLAVAEANLVEARSLWEISKREIERFNTLRDREFVSAADYETAEAQYLARQAQLKVAEAQLRRQQAVLQSARIQKSYTEVRVIWSGSGKERIVAERYQEVGDVVSPNQTLFRIIEIDPIKAVIHVTERDYVFMQPGQSATFETDAFKGEVFHGTVDRVSPVFRESTRQARVELSVQNPDYRLKPGMFVRVRITLDRLESATRVPEIALARRKDQNRLLISDPETHTVSWKPVEVLFLDDGRCAIQPESLSGQVVILGQHLLEDGSEISIVDTTIPSISQP